MLQKENRSDNQIQQYQGHLLKVKACHLIMFSPIFYTNLLLVSLSIICIVFGFMLQKEDRFHNQIQQYQGHLLKVKACYLMYVFT